MRKILMSVLLLSFLSSCDNTRIYEENTEITASIWGMDRAYEFEALISDTLVVSNVNINIRNDENYAYSNLFLFITTTAPDGNWIKDTLEVSIADKRGKWTGRGFGGVYFRSAAFKPNVRFPYKGVYRFRIEQAMRDEQLMGIRDIGVRIERRGKDRGEG